MDMSTFHIVKLFPVVALRLKGLKDLVSGTWNKSDLQAQIDSEALHLEAALLEFKALHNSCVPFLRLPPEVLLQIVILLVSVWPTEIASCAQDGAGYPGWITVAYLSSSQRYATWGRRQIWADSVYALPRARDTVFARAGHMPLSHHLCHPNMIADDIRFVLDHLPQARALMIDLRTQRQDEDTWTLEPAQFSTRTLPLLEVLTLRFKGGEEVDDRLTLDVWELPPPVTPRLKILRLFNMIVPFNPLTLTTLCISFYQVPREMYTPAHFLDFLRQLQELELRNAIPDHRLVINGDHSAVELRELQRLTIWDAITLCVGFWSQISIPPSCVAVIHLNEIEDH